MGWLLLLMALTLNATANILLKLGATQLGELGGPDLLGRVIQNYYLFAGILLFALNVVFYFGALSRLDLSVAYPVMVAGGTVIVVSVSALLLGEAIDTRQAMGLVLLIAGIVLVSHRSFG